MERRFVLKIASESKCDAVCGNLWSFEHFVRRAASDLSYTHCAYELALSLQHTTWTTLIKIYCWRLEEGTPQNSFQDERAHASLRIATIFSFFSASEERWYALQVFEIGFALKSIFVIFNWLCFIFSFVFFSSSFVPCFFLMRVMLWAYVCVIWERKKERERERLNHDDQFH